METATPEAPVDRECFVICPIGPDKSEIRKRSDQVLKYVIEETVAPLGYKVVRADRITESGRIDSQILEHVVDASLVIADLTGANPNVFYELAVRHAIAKPFIQICKAGDGLPFDIQGLRTIFFDHTDLDSVNNAKEQLKASIASVTGVERIETPLSITVDLAALRNSGDPSEQAEAQILDRITAMERVLMRALDPRRASPISPADYMAVREVIEKNASDLPPWDLDSMVNEQTSPRHDRWVKSILSKIPPPAPPAAYSDEPPF